HVGTFHGWLHYTALDGHQQGHQSRRDLGRRGGILPRYVNPLAARIERLWRPPLDAQPAFLAFPTGKPVWLPGGEPRLLEIYLSQFIRTGDLRADPAASWHAG